MKHFLLFCLALLLCAVVWAEPKQLDDTNTYWDTTGTAPNYTFTISGTGDMPDFVSYTEQPWNALSTSITKVVVEQGVTSVGICGFAYLSNLTEVTLPAGLTSIGEGAFGVCSSLTSITLPAGLTSIGDRAFYSCIKLPSIILPASLTSIGIQVFVGCSSLTSIILPASLTSIGGQAFESCSSLASIILPARLTSIGTFAFRGCSSLASITSLNPTPPIIVGTFFSEVDANCVLEVPNEPNGDAIKAAYENATASGGWNWTNPIEQKTVQPIEWEQTFGTKVCGDATIDLEASAPGTHLVTYISNNKAVATVIGTTLTIVGPGQAIIVALQEGDDTYLAAQNEQRVITVIKGTQTITWEQAPSLAATYGGEAIELNATASSTLAVSYSSSDETAGWISAGNTLNIGALGSSTITATQAGNNCYHAAPEVQITIAVSKQDQSIFWNQTLHFTAEEVGMQVTLSAIATSGLPVRYSSSATTVAVIVDDSVLKVVGAGMAFIAATQEGNIFYNPALMEQQVVTVNDSNKQNQTIEWEQTLDTAYNGNPTRIALNATASSGLAVFYISSNTGIAVIDNNEVVIVGTGQVTITAVQEGNTEYNPAPAVQQILTVRDSGKFDQTIKWEQLFEDSYNAAEPTTIVLEATSNSGLNIRYLSSNTRIATIKGDVLTFVGGAGRVVITATQPGNKTYNPAPVKTKTLVAIGDPNDTIDAYPFDTYVTTMYCNLFMINLHTLRTDLNKDKAAGLDTVIINSVQWFCDGEKLTDGVAPADEFIAGSSYSAGDSETAKLKVGGVYHFELHLSKVYTDGTVDTTVRSGNRIVGDDECTEEFADGHSTKLVVYPNPVAGSRSIFVRAPLDASPRADNNRVRIYRVSNGTLVKEVQRLSEITEITLSLARGTYSVQTGGEQVKIVVQ